RVMLPGLKLYELVVSSVGEARAHRGRGAEEIEQEPRGTAESADQAEVLLVSDAGQREVVVVGGDRLHAPAVAMREAEAIVSLRAADVGDAIAADRDQVVRRQVARHARAPQDLLADRPVNNL